MPILYKEAKEILSRYAGPAGVCATDSQVDLFIRQVLEYLLISGSYGNTRKFCFNAVKGCFTIPYELETPIKVKIDEQVGSVWNRWFEYHDSDILNDCVPAASALFEDPNYYPTVYDMPEGGARVGITATCNEVDTAHVIVQGVDPSGREIFTVHKGEKIHGEYLTIKTCDLRYTQTNFAKVTAVLKTKTNGYTPLYWVNPGSMLKGFLADYSPLEEKPAYRRYKLTTPCGPSVKVSVLGRIRLREAYTDVDYIPFDNVYNLFLAGQAVNANYNTDVNTAVAKDKMMTDFISREAAHKTPQPGTPLEVFGPLSAGHIRNINVGWLRRW